MHTIAGLPFWELTFDADGDHAAGAFATDVLGRGITDLVVFAHGWNTDQAAARALYEAFFGLLAGQLRPGQARVGLAGVVWPAQRWADEPIPDFAGGAAGLDLPQGAALALDRATLAGLHTVFPAAAGQLDALAAILAEPPDADSATRFHKALGEFAAEIDLPGDDGEGDGLGAPRMLRDEPAALFERYADALRAGGPALDDGGGGAAGLGDVFGRILRGAKEALRQATYWAMKNRAGVVGQRGLGPLLDTLPGVRVHLVGHSFGARLVSYALAGLAAGPSPVRSVTLLQGAFSHYAFADRLPFDAGRGGALAGMPGRVDGPLVACFSTHDTAVGTFYPLASFAAGDDSAGAEDALFRWGGIGAHGAQAIGAPIDPIQPAGPGATYRFTPGRVLNVDTSEVVRFGGPPSGAHNDIVHPELTWLVLSAARMV